MNQSLEHLIASRKEFKAPPVVSSSHRFAIYLEFPRRFHGTIWRCRIDVQSGCQIQAEQPRKEESCGIMLVIGTLLELGRAVQLMLVHLETAF